MTIAAKGAVRKVVVSTPERIGRGSCAEIERRGDIAEGAHWGDARLSQRLVVCNSFFAFVRGYCEQVLNKLEFRNRAKH